jgi:hypothetical protein
MTSAEINAAVETLRAAGMDPALMVMVEHWNVTRLQAAAKGVTSAADVAALFQGIAPDTLARAGIV